MEKEINFDKWRRAKSGKAICKFEFPLKDSMTNKSTLTVSLMYEEKTEWDSIWLRFILIGANSGISHALSNMCCKPVSLMSREETVAFKEENFNKEIIMPLMTKKNKSRSDINKMLGDWFETSFEEMIIKWIQTGYKKIDGAVVFKTIEWGMIWKRTKKIKFKRSNLYNGEINSIIVYVSPIVQALVDNGKRKESFELVLRVSKAYDIENVKEIVNDYIEIYLTMKNVLNIVTNINTGVLNLNLF